MLRAIYGRIRERLDDTGLSASAASRLAGLNPDAIRNIQRAVQSGRAGRVGVSTRTLAALAPVLGTTSAWLLEGKSEAADDGLMNGDAKLPFVDWAQAGTFADADTPLGFERRLGDPFGRWPRGYFATQVPDDAMNRLAPAGAYIVVDRHARSLVEGLSYLGELDGAVIFRRWFGDPDRAEPYSTDPMCRTEFLTARRPWRIIGRVRRAIIEI
jgi:SOS-response transcriptional repressor LexA